MSPALGAPVLPAVHTALRRRWTSSRIRFVEGVEPDARQLLVDVSVIVREDARTGIQRVVRALLGQLVAMAHPDLVIQPVFAARDHGFCRATMTADGIIRPAGAEPNVLETVVVRRGDIYLGLDLAAHLLPHVEADLVHWRRIGVALNIVVYDLLALERPEWFSARLSRNIERWVGVLERQADRCICISQTVAVALKRELARRNSPRSPDIRVIPLGSDVEASYPTRGLPGNMGTLRQWVRDHRVLLSVGTIEPRKGHSELLAALTRLWDRDPLCDVALIVVGRPGWKTEELQNQLHGHREQGRRLMWLQQASDELLSELYSGAAGLVAASHGEGFGLPLLEALAHKTPVLARDLPVFREIGGTLFDYFQDDTPDGLACCIQAWLSAARRPTPEDVRKLPRWSDSAAALVTCLRLSLDNGQESAVL